MHSVSKRKKIRKPCLSTSYFSLLLLCSPLTLNWPLHRSAPGGSAFAPASSQPAWSDRAVEVQLVYALKRAKLLRTLGEAQYQRCGRTDKGVSALGQVRENIHSRFGARAFGNGESSDR